MPLRSCRRLFRLKSLGCRDCISVQLRAYSSSASELPETETKVRVGPGFTVPEQRKHLKNVGRYYVTTPIFYVNGEPHIGHMHSMVVADIIARYKKLQRKKTLLLTGTDEHGIKIQRAAEAAGKDPLEYCTDASQKFRKLAENINMMDHSFIRTTSPEHRIAVHTLWEKVAQQGFIYKGKHEGWYSVTDECFYKESQIEERLDDKGEAIKVSKETGSKVEWESEENYMFRLSKFQPFLLDYYTTFPQAVVPENYYKDVLSFVSQPLEDLSISRPRSRLHWGIPVPGDDSQTVYVWFDALVNYLTATGYPWPEKRVAVSETATPLPTLVREPPEKKHNDDEEPGNLRSAWPADVHVIGKDIVRFHCVFWPAFLTAAQIALPRQVLVHGHWTQNGQKMSKSLGNVVSPNEVFKTFHPDVVRYYMIKEGGSENGGNWNVDSIQNRYTYLANTWGNMVNRLNSRALNLHGAVWTVLPMPGQYKGVPSDAPEDDQRLQNAIDLAVDIFRSSMDNFELEVALSTLDNLVRLANQYISFVRPWRYVSDKDEHGLLILYSILFRVGEALRVGSILAQPFMPVKAGALLDRLNVAPFRRGLQFARWAADHEYGKPWLEKRQKAVFVFPKMPWMEKPSDVGGYKEQRKAAETDAGENSGLSEERAEVASQ